VLIVTQEAPAGAPNFDHLPATIVRDPERKTFGTYQVAVMPSIVVIDREGHVVYAMAGMIPRLADLLTDSLLYASGKLNADTLDRSLAPAATTRPSEENLRAERIALLARQLMRRGLDELASEKYEEALKLDPKLQSAHLDLGTLLLKHQRLAEAEKQFRSVLAGDANSLQANLGLAFVQTMRGGSELDEAEKTVRAMLVRSPVQPRAHYLLGLIHERRGKPEDAAASFKKSSELLLERAEQE
jgi:tetratricopeptide (TPR) repeat protein